MFRKCQCIVNAAIIILAANPLGREGKGTYSLCEGTFISQQTKYHFHVPVYPDAICPNPSRGKVTYIYLFVQTGDHFQPSALNSRVVFWEIITR